MRFPGWHLKDIQASPSTKLDAVLLLMLYLFNFFVFSQWHAALQEFPDKPWLLLVWLYGLAILAPLFWRNKAPTTVFIAEWVLAVPQFIPVIIDWDPSFSYYIPVAGIPVALYAIAAHRGLASSIPALAASLIPNGLAAYTAAVLAADSEHSLVAAFISSAAFLVLATIGAFAAGRLSRASRQHIQELERVQAETREAEERERAETREAEALAAERRKIARELHDSVSHAVTVIVLLAAGASRVADTSLAQTKQSLVNIESTAKEAMAELRCLLAVLGKGSTNRPAEAGGLGSRRGLAGLTLLLHSARTTGMSVSVHLSGQPRSLAPNVDLTAYRIIQEGLTNVMKHVGEEAAPQLRITWEPDNLVIQIDNGTDLPAVANRTAITGGWGLRGLRERVHAVGGELTAGPHAGTGFRLRTTLPVTTPPISRDVPPSESTVESSRAAVSDRENQEKIRA